MKPYTQTTAAILLALGLSAGGLATAEEGADIAAPPAGESCPKKFGHGERGPFSEKRLETLRTELKLTPEQETGWNTWSGQVKAHLQEMKDNRPDWKALENMPAPDRMEKMLTHGRERLSRLEQDLTATKTFYATLTPEQRQVFDQQFKVFRPGGWKGRHQGE